MLNPSPEGKRNLYLTPRSFSLLLKSISNGSRFRIHPFVWNSKQKTLERSTYWGSRWVWVINAWIPILYFVFVVVRSVQTLQDPECSRRDAILALFGVAFYLFPATFQLTYLVYGDEFPGLVNQGLRLLSSLNRQLPPSIEKKSGRKYPAEVKIAQLLSYMVYYGFQVLGLWVMIFGLAFPKTKFLVSSLHGTCCYCVASKMLSFGYLGYITENYIVAACLIILALILIVFPLCVALDELSHQPLTKENLHRYRCIELWISKFNRVYSPVLLPITQILLITLTTLGIVGPVRYPGVIGALVGNVGIVTYTLLYMLLRFFARINTGSRTVIERWKKEARGSAARNLRALRPMKVYIGSCTYADMCLILTSSHIIVTNSIAMLLVD